MTERNQPEHRHIPDWAERERGGDLAWIRDNLHIFWPVAQQGYKDEGRGAIVVDTTSRPTGEGHPFGYLSQMVIEQANDEDTQRLVGEYDPTWEFVTVLFKPQDRLSTYRVGVVQAKPSGKPAREENPGKPAEADLYKVAEAAFVAKVDQLKQEGKMLRVQDITNEEELDEHFDQLTALFRQTCEEMGLAWPPPPLEEDEN